MTGTKKLKNNIYLAVAFVLPIFILIAVFISREIYPFGDQMYLRSDMYHQYAPFLKLFQTELKEGGSLAYSWKIGLGSNFISTYAYYLASPLNWLVALLPKDNIPEIMSSFIIFKSGLMSATFAFYLRKKFGRSDLLPACFGIFYSLSAYMTAYSWNVMWLDCLVLFPLMMLGLEKLVKEKKHLLYTITLALSVISNYYIAIMMCIFSLLYFIYLMLAESDLKDIKNNLKSLCRYIVFSLTGGLMGAAVFIPALLNLMQTASADSAFPKTLTAYFGVTEMLSKGMINMPVTMLEGYLPNIYCTVMVFALLPLYWINKKIAVKQRAGRSILLLLLALSFALNIPAFIWHGFHFPNSLPARHSFIYIFIILTIGYEVLMKIRQYSYRSILICFGIGIAVVFALQQLYKSEEVPLSVAYISAAFLAGYCILAVLLRYEKLAVIFPLMALLAVTVAESSVNTSETGYGTTTRSLYVSDNEDIENALLSVGDKDIYRVEKEKRRTKNDGAWSDYRSASVFSSAANKNITDIYDAFGLQYNTNAYSYYGSTPLTASLLSVRYKLTEDIQNDPLLEIKGDHNGQILYKNPYSLPLGFMVREACQADVDLVNDDPFAVQNSFLYAAKRLDPVFAQDTRLTGKELRYTVTEDGRLFFYIDRKLKDLYIRPLDPDAGRSLSFFSTENDMIFDAGYHKAGDVLLLSTSDEEVSEFSVIPAYLDESSFKRAIDALSSESLRIISFKDTGINGRVIAESDGMLFTTIPYDKGWEVYIDGEKGSVKDFHGAFVQIPLSKGEHMIILRYHVPGFSAGMIISVCSVAFLVLITVLLRKKSLR